MQPEETLDPDDWEGFRTLAHRMVDDTLDRLIGLRQLPVWQPMPDSVRDSFNEPVPWKGIGAEGAYEAFAGRVRPYSNGNLHPRFWGWVQGNGTPLGMMAEMLAAALNPHMAGFNQAPALVEHQVITWLAELMGLPAGSSGVLVTGGTMANTIGLAVARHAKAGFDVREHGLQGVGLAEGARAPGALLVYGSTETHAWARKAVEFLGLGHQALGSVPVDAEYRLDIDALHEAIAEDRAAGRRPFCVIGTAGTVNTGATDDLRSLAALCRDEGLWFHVDGAFGALCRLSDRLSPLVRGIEDADSIGFDLHKWGCLPFEAACVLVRDAAVHREAFATTANYLAEATRGVMAGGLPFAERGLDLTRGFQALKIWMSLKAQGVDAWSRIIEQNVAQIRHLARRVAQHPDLELLAPVALNIVCFRYAPASLPEERRDAVNEELLLRLQESGIAVPSSTRIGGKFAIRVANVNHRSRREDFDMLVDAVLALGSEIVEQ